MYTIFNVIEAALWFLVAGNILARVPRMTPVQHYAVIGGALAFVAFGVSDLLESQTDGRIPGWLWGLKIACGTAILAARYSYIGWQRFRWYDREVLFGLGCLIAVGTIIALQRYVLPS